MPTFRVLWRGPAHEFSADVEGEGGGIVLEAAPGGTGSSTGSLVGLRATDGHVDWAIAHIEAQPGDGNETQYCGVGEHEVLLHIHGQLARIDLKTGRQLAYVSGSRPTILPGGISVSGETSGSETEAQGESHTITVSQTLAP